MSVQAYLLYTITVLIWGSTWLAIKFQLGEVDPLVSVIYRSGTASLLLFGWCVLARARIRLSLNEHIFIALQGVLLFGLNYWLLYWSEVYLSAGVVAVVFATMVFMNVVNSTLFLRRPVAPVVVAGGLVGIVGVGLLFWPEVSRFNLGDGAVRGLLLALASAYCASLGTIAATRNATFGLPVISVNAWGMFYGSVALLIVALFSGMEFGFPARHSYAVSLAYLTFFGTVIAFGAYLRLLALIGPDRAGYNSMMTPLVALLISTFFEGYTWTVPAALGLVLIVAGNLLAMRRAAAPA